MGSSAEERGCRVSPQTGCPLRTLLLPIRAASLPCCTGWARKWQVKSHGITGFVKYWHPVYKGRVEAARWWRREEDYVLSNVPSRYKEAGSVWVKWPGRTVWVTQHLVSIFSSMQLNVDSATLQWTAQNSRKQLAHFRIGPGHSQWAAIFVWDFQFACRLAKWIMTPLEPQKNMCLP